MNPEIVSSGAYAESLSRKYKDFQFPPYKLRKWFSKTHMVFFDCREPDKEFCLQTILKKTDYEAFVVFFALKDHSGSFRFLDAIFRNLGVETLERFMTRFHSQLESMTSLGVQAGGLEYAECVGHSYIESSK